MRLQKAIAASAGLNHCDECKVLHGRHTHTCSKITREQLTERCEEFYRAWQSEKQARRDFWQRIRKGATDWQGKYSIVKHENNKLRSMVKIRELKRGLVIPAIGAWLNGTSYEVTDIDFYEGGATIKTVKKMAEAHLPVKYESPSEGK